MLGKLGSEIRECLYETQRTLEHTVHMKHGGCQQTVNVSSAHMGLCQS